MNLKPINDAIAALVAEHGAMPRDSARVKLAQPLLAARAALLDLERMNDADECSAQIAKSYNEVLIAQVAADAATIADLNAKLTASEAECQRLQAEAVKCSAAAADMSRMLAATAKNERGIMTCMLEASGITPELIPLTEVLGWMKWNAKCLAAAGVSPADGAEPIADAPPIPADLRKIIELLETLVKQGARVLSAVDGASPMRVVVADPG